MKYCGCYLVLPITLVLILAGCVSKPDFTGKNSTAVAIRQQIEKHMAAMSAGDVDTVLSTLDPQARNDQGALDRSEVERIMARKMSYKLNAFKLLTEDGALAVARIESQISPGEGKPVQSLDMIQVFRKSGSGWLTWRVIPVPKQPPSGN